MRKMCKRLAFQLLFCLMLFLPPAYAGEFLPKGHLFPDLIADPKEPRFFVSAHRMDTDSKLESFQALSAGFGERIGLWRWGTPKKRSAWQLNLLADVQLLLNFDTASPELVNTDAAVGLELVHQGRWLTDRLRFIHQSSHLGDEYMLRNKITYRDRVNFSHEKLEYTLSKTVGDWRGYAGGSYFVRIKPSDYDHWAGQAGLEYQGPDFFSGTTRFLAGLDTQYQQEHDWDADISLKAGLAFSKKTSDYPRIRLMLEGYSGHAYFGQFYETEIDTVGLGLYLDF